MSNYGLYYTLNENIPEKVFPVSNKKKLIKSIETLNEQEKEAIILLIHEHYKNFGKKSLNENVNLIPYEGEQKGKNVLFDLEKLPNELCWILEKFMTVVHK